MVGCLSVAFMRILYHSLDWGSSVWLDLFAVVVSLGYISTYDASRAGRPEWVLLNQKGDSSKDGEEIY